jgi:hypothetical protein
LNKISWYLTPFAYPDCSNLTFVKNLGRAVHARQTPMCIIQILAGGGRAECSVCCANLMKPEIKSRMNVAPIGFL